MKWCVCVRFHIISVDIIIVIIIIIIWMSIQFYIKQIIRVYLFWCKLLCGLIEKRFKIKWATPKACQNCRINCSINGIIIHLFNVEKTSKNITFNEKYNNKNSEKKTFQFISCLHLNINKPFLDIHLLRIFTILHIHTNTCKFEKHSVSLSLFPSTILVFLFFHSLHTQQNIL